MLKCSQCESKEIILTNGLCKKCYIESLKETEIILDKLTFDKKIYTKSNKGRIRYFIEIPAKEFQFFNYKEKEIYRITIEKIR